MIQPVEMYDEVFVNGCCVHDMVFDLVRSLSSQENFVTVLDGDGQRQKNSGSFARRLALQRIKELNIGQVLANISVDKVRSFIASECNFDTSSWSYTPVLRVLDIDFGKNIDQSMLDHLGRLLHLRYLRLASSSLLDSNIELPKLRYLKFMQTLDLWLCGINELPEEMGLLTQLVCLRVAWCTRIPDGLIGKLTSLQELKIWPIYNGYDRNIQLVKELGMLRKLRVLDTWINVNCEGMERALLESLGNMHNIRTMHMEGNSNKSITRHAGFITCRHLQYLHLRCFVFFGLTAWIKLSLAPNLSCLYMRLQVLKEEDMETLARLPELDCLILELCDKTKLVNIKIPSPAEVGGHYFRKLRILRISRTPICFDLSGYKCNGSIASAIMPSLESLECSVCVRFLKDAAVLSLDRVLDFSCLGRTSLQSVSVEVNCEGACILDVDVEAALERTAAVHPNRPTLDTIRQEEEEMLSPYQEAWMDVNRTPDFVIKAWKFTDITDCGHIRALHIPPDPAASSSKVLHLVYTSMGRHLLTLSSNAILKLRKWGPTGKNPHGRPTTYVTPILLWQLEEGILITNDTTEANPGVATACIAISTDESYIILAYGGKISWFYTKTFELHGWAPHPGSTFLTFFPQNDHIIALGMDDSSIQIYNNITKKVQRVLMGHQKKVTGLTYSQSMNSLVSSGADAQLCVWSIADWENKKSRYIRSPSNGSALAGDTMVRFHYDQTHLLVVHESLLAIYDGKKLERLHWWSPKDALPSPISSAVYSSDGLMVYAGFRDGAIGIFEAESLRLQCRIAPSANIPSSIPSNGGIVYPMDVAVNPWYPNQIALGMSDGAVYLLEPLEE